MKKYCKLFILAAALMGGLSLNSCIDLDPIDYSDINPSTADLTRFYYTDTDAYSDGWLNDISRCTSVLAQIEACDFLSTEKKQRYAAEIRCARGLIS